VVVAAAPDTDAPDEGAPDGGAGATDAGPADEADTASDFPPPTGSWVAAGAATTLTKRLLPLTALALNPTARIAPMRAMPEMRTVMR
jgi:hypothetical protein